MKKNNVNGQNATTSTPNNDMNNILNMMNMMGQIQGNNVPSKEAPKAEKQEENAKSPIENLIQYIGGTPIFGNDNTTPNKVDMHDKNIAKYQAMIDRHNSAMYRLNNRDDKQ